MHDHESISPADGWSTSARAAVIAWSIARNGFPFAGIALLGWSAENVLWLSAFNVALLISAICIASRIAPNLQHATRRQLLARSVIWGLISVALAAAACAFGILNFAGKDLFDLISRGVFRALEASLNVWICMLAITAIPAFLRELQIEIWRSRSTSWRNDVFGNLLVAGLLVGGCPVAIELGDAGIAVWIAVLTAFAVFSDLWPNILRDMVRPPRKAELVD
jgi:hypothetical protein